MPRTYLSISRVVIGLFSIFCCYKWCCDSLWHVSKAEIQEGEHFKTDTDRQIISIKGVVIPVLTRGEPEHCFTISWQALQIIISQSLANWMLR